MRIKDLLLLFTCCLFTILSVAQKNNSRVSLKGQLKNFSNQVEVEDLSDLQYLLPASAARMIIPDTAGNFSISFNIQSPNYFRLGRNILYLSPGDNMEVFIDKNNPVAGRFKGIGSEPNLYLRNTPFPKGGSFVEAGRKVRKVARETIDTILQIAANREKQLAETKGISAEFRRLEKARVQADLVNSLHAAMLYYLPKISKDSLAVYNSEYKAIAVPLIDQYTKDFLDPSLMKLVVYRDVADEIIKHPGDKKAIEQIKDWFTASDLINDMKKASDKDSLRTWQDKVSRLKVPAYKAAVSKTLTNLLRFGKGDIAKDFTAVDMKGNKVKLSSLKGKVIYVDLWA
ncbi:MAG: Thiol-disulfide isomerase or thioredoxin, partial [Chitinophagaceae bacterium]|nr:Thiol-disulfide isomerase or thioredoxin [Chitinophagaceae bacterium]